MDKQLIAARFARARHTYPQEARIQGRVAETMLRLLQHEVGGQARFRHITEFGCGTGGYSKLLLQAFHPETMLLNDLCPEMEAWVACLGGTRAKVRFMAGDAETMTFPGHTELLTSCSTLQWFHRPECFISRCRRFLCDEGIFAFSTFGPGNLQEIKCLTGEGLDYLSLDELTSALSEGFDLLFAREETLTLRFDSPLQVLQHLRLTGVTGMGKRVWTRGRMEAFTSDYIRLYGDEAGRVTLRYHP
ncbi:MAG: malonyl-ACP O-methyltransferase BioC, partial [Prevotellaceae bacterium]|nr:malonyl-ACP O-methyltransferase BioC [Prevotellaceae bacterium]